MNEVSAPICPKCGRESVTVSSPYGPKHICCDLYSYGGKQLVSAEVHKARIAAHQAFDPLWKTGRVGRRLAYELLAKRLGLRKGECHMGLMNLEMLRRVPGAVWGIQASLWTQENKKCGCGNMLSVARQEAGIKICPRCERASTTCA